MRAWIELLNSAWNGHLGRQTAQDRLEDGEWLVNFLRSIGTFRIDPNSTQLRSALKKQRALFQRVADTCLAGKRLADDDLAALNRYLANESVQPQIRRENQTIRLELKVIGKGLDALLFKLAADVADFLIHEDASRLRACSNPDCRWIFYDVTRSRTGRWCGATCRSLIKVRALRERRKSGQDTRRTVGGKSARRDS